MPTAYEQLNFLNQQNQQALAPINNFLAQRNQIALQQAEAARQRAQAIEMENLRQQHALEAQKANFTAQQEAADANVLRARAEDNRKKLIDSGWILSPDLGYKEINNMADQYFGNPSSAEESSVEKASAIGGRVNSVLKDMTKDLANDTPEAQKKALMAFAADPTNNSLLTVEGKIPQQQLMEVVNKGDVNGLVGLINQAAKNAGWFSSDKQVAAQLMSGLYNSRVAANDALKTSPLFQAKQVQLQSLMQELGKATQGIQTSKGWETFGNAMAPAGKSDAQVAAEMKAALAKQQAGMAIGNARQTAVDTRLNPVTVSPHTAAPPTAFDQSLLGRGFNVVNSAGAMLNNPGPTMANFAMQNPQIADQAQDAYSGFAKGLWGGQVPTASPHEQLAKELYARGIFDPRLGVPEQLLKRGF